MIPISPPGIIRSEIPEGRGYVARQRKLVEMSAHGFKSGSLLLRIFRVRYTELEWDLYQGEGR
jgi:hypothetical protein